MGDIFPFNLFLQKKMDICKDLDMQIFDDKKHDKIVGEVGWGFSFWEMFVNKFKVHKMSNHCVCKKSVL